MYGASWNLKWWEGTVINHPSTEGVNKPPYCLFFLSLPFYSQMAIEKYNTDLLALTKTCEEMKKLYSVILVILELLFQYLFCTALEIDRPPLQ